ncbi:MAG: M1 family peptidase [Alphaproteobacteria bacterium]|nr:MAG: M1 family peptidase [Alphaproteobacteria bacterium]
MAHPVNQTKGKFEDKFRQLEEVLPTPNAYRTASGAPGHGYWQQRADYRIDVTLDEKDRRIKGRETITYHNNSPDTLRYLWVSVDQNRFRPEADTVLARPAEKKEQYTFDDIRKELGDGKFKGGHEIRAVRDAAGNPLPFTIVSTMMRIDLPQPLVPGASVSFSVEWAYNISDQTVLGGRSGYEHFKEDGNDIFQIAQWFPRMAAYTDVNGWQNKAFLGSGEFTLEFGDYEVAITVPADHIVAATGVLQNPDEVLTEIQRRRLEKARTADKPVYIVTPDEAKANEAEGTKATKTWRFKAENVRDFAFASSRKFMWDAWGHKQADGSVVMAMSFFPNEANPLWEQYSTHAIVHTLEHYSRYTFLYPYPVAQSVNGPVFGMEYPMISFNGPRPEIADDGTRTYPRRTKYDLISVIIHEIGHNYFPMIVNSDERQWTWMDEGLNTFLQFLAEQAWEENYPSRRGDPRDIVDYMKSENQVPIMTNSESLLQFGANAYGKPAVALNILRETILGRELFDFAFREYARRWQFKRPMPADLFRTLEDASGVDLDWFWRGWFYSTDHVDISLDRIRHFQINTKDPRIENKWKEKQDAEAPESVTDRRNRGMERRVDRFPELKDFYNENDEYTVTNKDLNDYASLLADLEEEDRDVLKTKDHFYILDFSNKGGLVMPIILAIEYENGDREELRLPAEIWRKSPDKVSKLLVRDRKIRSVVVDPYWETADVDIYNNSWPRKPVESRLEVYKRQKRRDMMKDMNTPLSDDAKKLKRR